MPNKKILIFLIFISYNSAVVAQYEKAIAVYDTLVAIQKQPGISAHFAALYTATYAHINGYAAQQTKSKQDFLMEFQRVFGEWFLKAHYHYKAGEPIPFNWQRFFKYDTLTQLQYWFLGINAHINGDMHQTLLASFPEDTLKMHRSTIKDMRRNLEPFFDSLYNIPSSSKKFERLHKMSLGMDRMVFRNAFFSWRMRQLRMIDTYFKNRKRYDRRLKRLQKEMLRWDNRTFKYLN